MSLCRGKFVASLLFVGTVFLSLKVTSSQIAPYFIEEPTDIIVKKNRHAVLKCRAGGQPTPTISWKRNDADLDLSGDTRRRVLPDGSLFFRTIEHSRNSKPDEGTYQCIAMSRYNNLDYVVVSRTAKLQISGLSSRITIEPRRLQVKFDDIARLYCKVRHAVPTPTIQWKFKPPTSKNGTVTTLSESNKITILPGGVLQVRNAQFTDSGAYMCTVRNPVTGKEHSSNFVSLTVLADSGNQRLPGFVSQLPSSLNATKSSRLVLECAVKGNPKPRVTWYKNGQQVTYDDNISVYGESNLEIKRVAPGDAGLYKCEATGLSRPVSQQVKLMVNYPPILTKTLKNHNTYVSSSVNFYCTAEGSPTPSITWLRNGAEIINTDFTIITKGTLRVEDLLQADMAVYQCFASNSLGSNQSSAELAVYKQGVPLPTTSLPTTTPRPTTTQPPTTLPATTTESPRPPERPENVRTTTLSDTEIEVSWSPPRKTYGKIKSYNIFYVLDKVGDSNTASVPGDNLRVKISNLKPNSAYKFVVYAQNKHGTGGISEPQVYGRTAPSANVPGPPQSLVAVALSSSEIKVQWSVPVSGSSPERYVVEYQETSGKSPQQSTVTQKQQKTLRSLKLYTEYRIKVFGFSNNGLRGAEATINAFTLGGIPKGKPRDLKVLAAPGGRALVVTWKPPHPSLANGKIIKYALYYRRAGKTKSKRVELGNVEAHTLNKLQPYTKYEVQVAAGTASGFGEFTDWVMGSTNITKCTASIPPSEPQNLHVTLPSKSERMVKVEWQPPRDAGQVCVTEYIVQYGAGNPFDHSKSYKANVTSVLLDGLTAGKTYIIKVTAKNLRDNGPSVEESIFIPSSGAAIEKPVKNVEVQPLSSSVLRVTWTEFKNRRSQLYHVYHALKKTVVYCGNTTIRAINCTGLKPFTYYVILVRRNGERVNGTATNQTLQAKPSPPTDITLSATDDNTTDLFANWQIPDKVNGKILRYKICYSKDPDAAMNTWGMKISNGTGMQTKLKGLTPGTKYYFRMQVENGAGWGEMSMSKMIVTPNGTASDTGSGAKKTSMVERGHPGSGAEKPTVVAQVGGEGGLKDKTLWIIIAAVAGVTLIAIIIISVVLCKKRSIDDIQMPRKPPPTYKSAISNGSAKKKHKEEKPPDLWINHAENMEMKPLTAQNPPPDVANIPRHSLEMKPLIDDPIDKRNFEQERNSFRKDSECDADAFPHPPAHMLHNDDDGLPSPVSSPGPAPYHPVVNYPRSGTPDSGAPYPSYPMTSTPRYDKPIPRSGSFDKAAEPMNSAPPQRSYSYDLAEYPQNSKPTPRPKVPVFPMPDTDGPHYKVPVTSSIPRDDIELPPVGYNRGREMPRINKTPNGIRSPPPAYHDLYNQTKSPTKDTDDVITDLDKEIAGLEGLMKDLNDITTNDLII